MLAGLESPINNTGRDDNEAKKTKKKNKKDKNGTAGSSSSPSHLRPHLPLNTDTRPPFPAYFECAAKQTRYLPFAHPSLQDVANVYAPQQLIEAIHRRMKSRPSGTGAGETTKEEEEEEEALPSSVMCQLWRAKYEAAKQKWYFVNVADKAQKVWKLPTVSLDLQELFVGEGKDGGSTVPSQPSTESNAASNQEESEEAAAAANASIAPTEAPETQADEQGTHGAYVRIRGSMVQERFVIYGPKELLAAAQQQQELSGGSTNRQQLLEQNKPFLWRAMYDAKNHRYFFVNVAEKNKKAWVLPGFSISDPRIVWPQQEQEQTVNNAGTKSPQQRGTSPTTTTTPTTTDGRQSPQPFPQPHVDMDFRTVSPSKRRAVSPTTTAATPKLASPLTSQFSDDFEVNADDRRSTAAFAALPKPTARVAPPPQEQQQEPTQRVGQPTSSPPPPPLLKKNTFVFSPGPPSSSRERDGDSATGSAKASNEDEAASSSAPFFRSSPPVAPLQSSSFPIHNHTSHRSNSSDATTTHIEKDEFDARSAIVSLRGKYVMGLHVTALQASASVQREGRRLQLAIGSLALREATARKTVASAEERGRSLLAATQMTEVAKAKRLVADRENNARQVALAQAQQQRVAEQVHVLKAKREQSFQREEVKDLGIQEGNQREKIEQEQTAAWLSLTQTCYSVQREERRLQLAIGSAREVAAAAVVSAPPSAPVVTPTKQAVTKQEHQSPKPHVPSHPHQQQRQQQSAAATTTTTNESEWSSIKTSCALAQSLLETFCTSLYRLFAEHAAATSAAYASFVKGMLKLHEAELLRRVTTNINKNVSADSSRNSSIPHHLSNVHLSPDSSSPQDYKFYERVERWKSGQSPTYFKKLRGSSPQSDSIESPRSNLHHHNPFHDPEVTARHEQRVAARPVMTPNPIFVPGRSQSGSTDRQPHQQQQEQQQQHVSPIRHGDFAEEGSTAGRLVAYYKSITTREMASNRVANGVMEKSREAIVARSSSNSGSNAAEYLEAARRIKAAEKEIEAVEEKTQGEATTTTSMSRQSHPTLHWDDNQASNVLLSHQHQRATAAYQVTSSSLYALESYLLGNLGIGKGHLVWEVTLHSPGSFDFSKSKNESRNNNGAAGDKSSLRRRTPCMIGMTSRHYSGSRSICPSYFYMADGCLSCRADGSEAVPFGAPFNHRREETTVVTVHLNFELYELSFAIDGEWQGVAFKFSKIEDPEPLFPVVVFNDDDDWAELQPPTTALLDGTWRVRAWS